VPAPATVGGGGVGGGNPGQGGEGAKRLDLEADLRSEQAGAEGRRSRHESIKRGAWGAKRAGRGDGRRPQSGKTAAVGYLGDTDAGDMGLFKITGNRN
jgi:hypothetical protein